MNIHADTSIKTYGRTSGHLTSGQKSALDTLWRRYGINGDGPLDLDWVFGRHAPRYIEIGFGMGTNLAHLASAHPERDYLGIEVYIPGVGSLLNRLQRERLGNVRVIRNDARGVLGHRIKDGSLDGIMVFFPDPWPKKRHHKRRIIQPEFTARAVAKLRVGGTLHLATDYEPYALHMLEVLEGEAGLINCTATGGFAPDGGERLPSKFEGRGRSPGDGVWDLTFKRR